MEDWKRIGDSKQRWCLGSPTELERMKWSRGASNSSDQLEKVRFQRAPALKIHESADADLNLAA